MKSNVHYGFWLIFLFSAMLAGCVSAYHAYQGPCVPYEYCAEAPLPYDVYNGCHCPTPIAGQYQQQPLQPAMDLSSPPSQPDQAP